MISSLPFHPGPGLQVLLGLIGQLGLLRKVGKWVGGTKTWDPLIGRLSRHSQAPPPTGSKRPPRPSRADPSWPWEAGFLASTT